MKYIVLIVLLSLNSWSFDFESTTRDFEDLVEETNIWRSDTIEFLKNLSDNPGKIITSRQLQQIHNEGTLKYKDLRSGFYEFINRVRYISRLKPDSIVFNNNGDTNYSRRSSFWYRFLFLDQGNIFATLIDTFNSPRSSQAIDLSTKKGKDFVLNFKMALASALILYDNYNLISTHLSFIKEKSKIDRIINFDNSQIDDFLKKVEKEYSSISNYKAMKKSVKIYELIKKQQKSNRSYKSPFEKLVESAIESSYIFSLRDQITIKTVLDERIKFIKKWIRNKIRYRTGELTNSISEVFGNTMGLVATRKGKLISMSRTKFKKMILKIKDVLKPMDIILEKTPFRLTDKFIPGHWGHVAVWLGTESELKRIGKWNTLPKEIKSNIKSGKNILEALRNGVVMSSLEKFMNVDDFAVLRKNFINSKVDLAEHLERAIDQYGKEYDFNFDVETDKKIVCSELVYTIFNNDSLAWPLDRTLGRYTISPDNVANKATRTAQNQSIFSFTPKLLFLDGNGIHSNYVQSEFDALID